MGANPVWALGGTLPGDIAVVLNAPPAQDLIVTDVLITTDTNCEKAYLTLQDGTRVFFAGRTVG